MCLSDTTDQKGSQAPVKVNSHHLNLSAPPINSSLCQKLGWTRAVHGWVVFDEMCEWGNVLPNVSTSFPGYSRVNYVAEMSASVQPEKSRPVRKKETDTLAVSLRWLCCNFEVTECSNSSAHSWLANPLGRQSLFVKKRGGITKQGAGKTLVQEKYTLLIHIREKEMN